MFLPIHAVGLYNESGPGFKISDFVTSSYPPSLTVMLGKSQCLQSSFHGLLGMSQERTPGRRPLPNAEKELTNVDKFGSSLNIHRLPGELAAGESVVEGMEKCSWVHLACHGTQDMAEPLHSVFLLHDGKLTLSKIITKSFPHADFAFLSAYQTVTGNDNLSEEAVHLAVGMLAAGYRSVIATMWSIRDQDGLVITSEVYHHLAEGMLNSTRTAHALHHAVIHLCEQLGESSFPSWVPFIHVGM